MVLKVELHTAFTKIAISYRKKKDSDIQKHIGRPDVHLLSLPNLFLCFTLIIFLTKYLKAGYGAGSKQKAKKRWQTVRDSLLRSQCEHEGKQLMENMS